MLMINVFYRYPYTNHGVRCTICGQMIGKQRIAVQCIAGRTVDEHYHISCLIGYLWAQATKMAPSIEILDKEFRNAMISSRDQVSKLTRKNQKKYGT